MHVALVVTAGDLLLEDVVLDGTQTRTVQSIYVPSDPITRAFIDTQRVVRFHGGEFRVVELGDEFTVVSRPYAKGKDECDMLNDVDAAIRQYCLGLEKPGPGRSAILAALVAYELGKPETART
jgi:hypothetical protein